MWELLLLILTLIFILIYCMHQKFDYWKRKKVPFLIPTLFVGNYGDYILQKTTIGEITQKICKQFPDEPYVGAYYGTEPTLIVQDPELLKLICIKDFYYFSGRESSEYWDKEIITRSIFFLHGDRWKIVRQMLKPLYSTTKMKSMFPLIESFTHGFEKLIERETSVSNVVQVYALASRFILDCVGSCGFGIEINAMQDDDSNPFRNLAATMFEPTPLRGFMNVARAVWPRIFYSLGFTIFPKEVGNGVLKVITNVLKSREYKPSARNDFVDLMLSLIQKGYRIEGESLKNPKTGEIRRLHIEIDDELIGGQCTAFFGGAFETSSTTITLTLFEIAKSSETQLKVFDEIDKYLEKYNNEITYDCINELPYLMACIHETLRLNPPFSIITRQVIEDYEFPTGLRLEKGIYVHIPVYHLHHNPKYFPEPEKFRPERHLGEEKSNIQPMTYLPFGDGPRVCIGMRFSRMQIMAGLVTILRKYKVELADGMSPTLEFDPRVMVTHTKHDVNLKFLLRKSLEQS